MGVTQDLDGREAVITGGGRGLGRAIGLRLAAAGARITVLDLPAALDDLPRDWAGHGIDLADPDAQDQLRRIAAGLPGTGIVVANAGIVPPWRGVQDLDAAEWQRVMTVNVWGAAITLGAFAPALAASGHGSAIVMASINAYRAHPAQMLYTASKHGVLGVMRAAAQELGPQGVRVNAIAPGPIATPALMTRIAARHATGGPAPDQALAAMAGDTMLRRMATEDDVARVAHFLAGDGAHGMTGATLPVEAGLA